MTVKIVVPTFGNLLWMILLTRATYSIPAQKTTLATSVPLLVAGIWMSSRLFSIKIQEQSGE
jgi:hypothetical protein